MTSRGMFTGRCYLCGQPCGYTYCHEHKQYAPQLNVPYRRDTITAPTLADVDRLLHQLARAQETIATQELRLQAWRRTTLQAAAA